MDQMNCPSGDRVMSSGNAWALICVLSSDNVLGGRKWGQQEKQPFHRGNTHISGYFIQYRKWHLNSGSGILLFTLKRKMCLIAQNPLTFSLGTSTHLLHLSKANAKYLNGLNSHSGVRPHTPESCGILKSGGAFHPAFSKQVYDKKLQAKKDDKPK